MRVVIKKFLGKGENYSSVCLCVCVRGKNEGGYITWDMRKKGNMSVRRRLLFLFMCVTVFNYKYNYDVTCIICIVVMCVIYV